jgi:KDO2-lipid IV(A) lauroyltransferase
VPTGASDEEAATAINRSMEAVIGSCPSQYLWGYHRYKLPRPAPAPGSAAS